MDQRLPFLTNSQSSSEPAVHVLIVEDNTPDVLLTEEALRSKGVNARMTNYVDGEDACLHLATHQECPFDLVILDLNMPKIGGLQVLEALRTNPAFDRVPVMVLTSSIAKQEQQESFRLGATRFVRKPADLYEFLETVGSVGKELLAASSNGGTADRQRAGSSHA